MFITVPQVFRQRSSQSSQEFTPFSDNRYTVRLATSFAEIDLAQKLRFDVFNLELKEGLSASYITQRDGDDFDGQCDHLLVTDHATGRVIGTYRLQTFEMARAARGFYSETEFFLALLGKPVLKQSVELGRACIAQDHRNGRVLFLLWKGIWRYAERKGKRFLFGCTSMNSQDPKEGNRLFTYLDDLNYVDRNNIVLPKPDYICLSIKSDHEPLPVLPPLMSMYFRYGAKIRSYPAIDREFGTIDFLTFLDRAKIGAAVRSQFS